MTQAEKKKIIAATIGACFLKTATVEETENLITIRDRDARGEAFDYPITRASADLILSR